MNKRGFTLMELLVTMALVGIIVVIAGRAFSDSTKMRVRTQSMMTANEVAENVGNLLKDDISQMGAKSSREAGIDANYFDKFSTEAMPYVFMDPEATDADKIDSSSYAITTDEKGFSQITMKRLNYDQNERYLAVERVSWYVENGSLKRSCQTLFGTSNDQCPSEDPLVVDIAENVKSFKLVAAKPGISEALSSVLPGTTHGVEDFRLVARYGDDNVDPVQVNPASGGATVSLSGFVANYDFENSTPITTAASVHKNQVFLAEQGSDDGSWKNLCKKVKLEAGVEYEISFSMPSSGDDASRLFCPGRDHMSVGFRLEDGSMPSGLNDFLFYPPTVGDDDYDSGFRKMRFSVKEDVEDVCLAFTFVSYSPLAATGSIKLSKVKLKKVENSNYTFDETASIALTEKKFVKAIKSDIVFSINGEDGLSSLVIATPSNGPRD